MDDALLEKKKAACEILIAPCDSSDNEQDKKGNGQGSFCNRKRKRKRESLSDVLGMKSSYSPPQQIPWCMGFTSARVSESESDLSEPSSALYFVKGYESAVTAIITDSEDDLFFLNETVEFEPPDSDSEEEEEEEAVAEDEVVIISSEGEDPGAEGGDEYEEGQESDSDVDEDDLWACPQCNLKNHPMSRQCARCWVERHEWLPHLKRLSSEPGVDLSKVSEKTHPSLSLQKSASLAVAPSIDYSSEHTSSSQQTVTQSSETKDSESAFTPDLCVICLTQPRNASLVHGRTGHQVCCIGCAEKLKENKKKCPVCRKKIILVVKNFF